MVSLRALVVIAGVTGVVVAGCGGHTARLYHEHATARCLRLRREYVSSPAEVDRNILNNRVSLHVFDNERRHVVYVVFIGPPSGNIYDRFELNFFASAAAAHVLYTKDADALRSFHEKPDSGVRQARNVTLVALGLATDRVWQPVIDCLRTA